ncbi:hypothetical protein C8N39_110109, partial [Dietzia psychralcaliphila]
MNDAGGWRGGVVVDPTMTTTSSAAFGALRAVPEALDALGTEALSEVARSATLAQNLAAATRLQAAHLLVEAMRRLDREAHGPDPGRQPGDSGPADSRPAESRPAYARLDPADRARDHLTAAMSLTGWHAARL